MKINEPNRIGSILAYQKQHETKVQKSGQQKQRDEVRISAQAQEMLTNSQQTEGSRSEKIEDLKQAVSTGTYKVDAGKLAERMLPYLL
ncbi:flagellar biosynthesis anti-sigma factor FlgM [Cohnella lubricantis]|uniref:Negative regulator of flagellin synthesis n=1 Tax=Cohnella lubricantis TaxID=2163172 RepID=A0A841TBL2_9BACL|nr:flagellar biosynthesis anti-sigma factor FlgM [Cohnella lubricantis]MBB6677415.1 flagellar biosynthesis anti-sigma factor FlgM [Cohnella lubricantis]MBP2118694.1 negative regulator of flagellin synthesis FlgM [Cohnella lubricantis]